jgi:hypothetical protein
MPKRTVTAFSALLIAAAAAAAAPPPRAVTAVPASGPIRVDGQLLEPPWQTAGFEEFRQSDPQDGAMATERTTVWVAFDKNNLYVAARCRDAQPGRIVRLLGRRDEEVPSDWFYLGVDPYYDRRTGYYFGLNPAGAIIDGTISNDETQDSTWDGVWEGASRVDGGGWTLEMRIPFDQLRFRRQEAYLWGVNFVRIIKRRNETDWFSWKPKEESGLVSRFADLRGLRDIDPGRRLEVLPYAAGRAGFNPAEPGNPFRTGQRFTGYAGLDLKAGLRTNLTLDATINPDFGQVEVDPAVINISDQETFYKEKRPFFIEGASLFNFGSGGPNVQESYGWTDPVFFYSRRIGRSPQGSPTGSGFYDLPDWTSILGAAKVTGRIGQGFSLGAIGALTQREYAQTDIGGLRSRDEVEPFTGYGVARLLKEWDGGRRGLGFMATAVVRDLRDPDLASLLSRDAFALGADGWAFLDRDRTWVVSGWAEGTRVTGTPAAITRLEESSLHYFQRPDIDYVHLDTTATSLSGWAGRVLVNKQQGALMFNAALGAMSPGFEDNDIGYHNRGDLINGHVLLGFQAFHPGPVFRTWKVWTTYFRDYDFGGNRTGEIISLDGEGQFLNYWTLSLGVNYEPPKYSHWLTRGGPLAYYPPGTQGTFSLESDDRRPFVLKIAGQYRTHPDGGYNWTLAAGLVWNPRANVSLSVLPSFTWRYSQGQWVTKVVDPLKVETYGTRYILSDILERTLPIEIRLNWTFTPRLSLQAYLQPYIDSGDYRKFKELRAARTFDFHFFGQGDSTLVFADGVYTVDPDGPGPAAPFRFANPDFRVRSLRGTCVLRWEYRPGSTLYFVWTQRRSDAAETVSPDFWDDIGAVFRASGENVFLIKFSYLFQI